MTSFSCKISPSQILADNFHFKIAVTGDLSKEPEPQNEKPICIITLCSNGNCFKFLFKLAVVAHTPNPRTWKVDPSSTQGQILCQIHCWPRLYDTLLHPTPLSFSGVGNAYSNILTNENNIHILGHLTQKARGRKKKSEKICQKYWTLAVLT